jgi:hypothetical protein
MKVSGCWSSLGLAAVFGLLACSSHGGDKEQVQTSKQELTGTTQSVSASVAPIDWSRPTSVKTQPFAPCYIYPEGAGNDPTRTEFIGASSDGFVRFYPPPAAWGVKLTLNCKVNGQTVTYQIDLNDSSTFTREADLVGDEPPAVTQRPALTGDLLKPSNAELLRGMYPPRPDPSVDSERYARWVERVTTPYEFTTWKPVIAIGKHADPFRGHGSESTTNNATVPTWSGQIVAPGDFNTTTNPPTPYASTTEFVIYEAAMYAPPSSCAQPYDCSAGLWGGLGGFKEGTGGLIQSGFWESGNWCPQDTCKPRSPFIFAQYASASNSLAAIPFSWLNYSQGDTIYFLGWACDTNGNVDVSGPYGCFSFENYSTAKGLGGYGYLQRPPGYRFDGRTAEWIVELQINGGDLADYSSETMSGVAWDQNDSTHADTTDPWILLDMRNSVNNLLSCTSIYGNGGCGSSDTTGSAISFSWVAPH